MDRDCLIALKNNSIYLVNRLDTGPGCRAAFGISSAEWLLRTRSGVEARIADELQLKLSLRVSLLTVGKYVSAGPGPTCTPDFLLIFWPYGQCSLPSLPSLALR